MSFSTSNQLPATSHVADEILSACRDLVRDEVVPQVEAWDRDDILPQSVLDRVGEIGVAGALVPARYGGRELSVAAMVEVWRTLAQGWISLTGAVNTTHLGTALLVRYGTEAQRERWLPGIAAGEIWSSFSITEPQAGSDLRRLELSVEPTDDGLILNGQKRWIAGGLSFPLTLMLARETVSGGQSCVILPSEGRGTESWSVEMLDKLGYRGVESAAWRFNRHAAAGAEILGGDEGHGMGANQMLDVLAIGRVNVACRALGIIDRALELAVAESASREIGRGVLADYTHAQLRIGDMRSRQRVIEAIVEKAAASIDSADPDAGELATAAKLSASDTAIWAVDTASRLAASRSYTWESELSRLRRDAPQTQIGEGANDALLLATGKAFIRAHADGSQ